MILKNAFELLKHSCIGSITVCTDNGRVYTSRMPPDNNFNVKNTTAAWAFNFELDFFRVRSIKFRRTFDGFGVVWESTVENISNHPEWSLRAIFRELEYSNFFRIVWKKSVSSATAFLWNANFFPKIALNKSFRSLRIRNLDRNFL